MKTIFRLLFLPMLLASLALAQRGGIPSFQAADVHEFDVVNLVTLVPSLNIPILAKSVGPLPGSIALESPQSCRVDPVGKVWTCGTSGTSQLAAFFPIIHEMMGMFPTFTTTSANGCTTYSVSGITGSDQLSFYPINTTQLFWPARCGVTSATVTTIDGSGYTFTLNSSGVTVALGNVTNPAGWVWSNGSGTLTDAFGNVDTNSGTSFTDSLGAVTTLIVSGTPEYSYTDTNGSSQNITETFGSSQTFVPLDGTNCNATGTNQPVTPLTSVNFPDGTSYGIGWQTNGSGLSGLVNSLTLRTKGAISYTYGTLGATSCSTWSFNSLQRTTPDGTTNYTTSFSNGITTTTVLDPGKNKIVYTFFGGPVGGAFTQSITRYQNTGTIGTPSYTLISSTSYCYNTLSCSTAPSYPITQLDTYEYVGTGSTQLSHDVQTYDSYGNVLSDANTELTKTPNQTITNTYVYGTWGGTSCGPLGNTSVRDTVCSATTTVGTNQTAQTLFVYNSNGAMKTESHWISGTGANAVYLNTTYVPNTNGTNSQTTDPNNQVTTFSYTTGLGGCNNGNNPLLLASSSTTVNGIVISTGLTWDCNGAMVIATTDANNNEDDATYNSMFQVHTYNDQLENTTTYNYTYNSVETIDPLNVQRYTYFDSTGRPYISQTRQSPTSSNYDTLAAARGWCSSCAESNFETDIGIPCVTTALGSTCGLGTVAFSTAFSPVVGVFSTSDANGGTLTTARNANDVSTTGGPKPSSDNSVKTVQKETDGFGRIKSICALETSGGTTCGQAMGGQGILSSSSYSFGAASSTITTTRGSQTHTTIADAIGRVTSIAIPESGTTTNVYDSQTNQDACSPSGGRTSNGDLLRTNLPDGTNYVCYIYDGLHRLAQVGNSGSNHTVNPCKRFKYDSTANGNYTPPSGYPSSGANIIGRLMEASTDDCGSTKLTDEWFAYDKDGRMTDMWEYTPINQTYYHTSVVYNADGLVTTLNGYPFNGSTTSVTYGVDGEGRWNSATLSAGSTVLVPSNGVTYDAIGRPTQVSIGTGTDKDTYSYDNVGNMSQYQFFVGSNNAKGILTWNSIGSLGSWQSVDGFNSGNNQTCSFAYDDVARLIWDGCIGTNPTYTYDQYDNITKSGTFPFNPGYSSTNNHFTLAGVTYDGNGNLTTDTNGDTYTWDLYGTMSTFNSGAANTYDAFGWLVGIASVSPANEVLFTPMGRMGTIRNSTTSGNSEIPLPGGGILNLDGAGGIYYNHLDWLGSARVQSIISTGVVADDRNFGPFGEVYQTNNHDDPLLFAGMKSDIFNAGSTWGYLYDTPNREYCPSCGRFQTPDPANASWNAYAYVTDPNTETDPDGLGDPPPSGPVAPYVCTGWLCKLRLKLRNYFGGPEGKAGRIPFISLDRPSEVGVALWVGIHGAYLLQDEFSYHGNGNPLDLPESPCKIACAFKFNPDMAKSARERMAIYRDTNKGWPQDHVIQELQELAGGKGTIAQQKAATKAINRFLAGEDNAERLILGDRVLSEHFEKKALGGTVRSLSYDLHGVLWDDELAQYPDEVTKWKLGTWANLRTWETKLPNGNYLTIDTFLRYMRKK